MPKSGDVVDGRYRLDAVIGRGGTSIVYRATHLGLEIPVAVKVLKPTAALLEENVVRLAREARATACLDSPYVTRTLDAGTLANGVPYLVMELLDGEDLASRLARSGPLPVGFACQCILQACTGLAAAHARGIVHRDLKPANLFLDHGVAGEVRVKVLDFGISRAVGAPPRDAVTDPGTVLGTPCYMAPEQMESSDAVDPRIDVWALGAILHELLVGQPPFDGESLPQIFLQILRSRAPRPSALRVEVWPALDAVVARCLAPRPADRFGSVSDLAVALESAMEAGRERRRLGVRLRRAMVPAALFGLGTSLALVLGVTPGEPRATEREEPASPPVSAPDDGGAPGTLTVADPPVPVR